MKTIFCLGLLVAGIALISEGLNAFADPSTGKSAWFLLGGVAAEAVGASGLWHRTRLS